MQVDVISLDGWILDSGQHPPIAPNDDVNLAIEIGSIVRTSPGGRSPALTWSACRHENAYAGMAHVIEITPRVTVFDLGTLAYAATSLVENALATGDEYTLAPGDAFAVAVTLGADPYLGRTRPTWLPHGLIRSWTVAEVLRRDAGDPGYRPVPTTLPHSAATSYELRLTGRPRDSRSAGSMRSNEPPAAISW